MFEVYEILYLCVKCVKYGKKYDICLFVPGFITLGFDIQLLFHTLKSLF